VELLATFGGQASQERLPQTFVSDPIVVPGSDHDLLELKLVQ